MSLTSDDLQDVKMSRPVAVVDLWSIDDRISRLEALEERLEAIGEHLEAVGERLEARENRLIAAIQTLEALYRSERVKNWELILKELLKKEDQKARGHHNDNRTFGAKSQTADTERPV